MGRDTRRTRVLLGALLLLAITLITIDYKTGRTGRLSGAHSAAHTVLGPLEDGVAAVAVPIGRFFSGVGNIGGDKRRADRLATQNAALQRQLADQAEVRRQAAELDRLRLVADEGSYTILPARVIATGDTTGTDWTVTINAGTHDGLRNDQLVLDADGLVGSVVAAGPSTSVVRLAVDPRSHIGARLEKTRLLGAVSGGAGPSRLSFTLYDTSLQISVGDRLVTYGSLDYAAGVPIGTVTKVTAAGSGLTRTADVRPFVNFGALDTVAVVVGKPATDPGDRVLRPRPTASPTAGPGSATGTLATSGARR